MAALQTYAAGAAAGTIPAEITAIQAVFTALPSNGTLFPQTKWGQYAMAAIEASAAYETAIAGPVATVHATLGRITNEYAENAVWVGQADVAGTAVAQQAAYTAAVAAFTSAAGDLSKWNHECMDRLRTPTSTSTHQTWRS